MPKTDVYFYQEAEDDVPVLDWLRDLSRKTNVPPKNVRPRSNASNALRTTLKTTDTERRKIMTRKKTDPTSQAGIILNEVFGDEPDRRDRIEQIKQEMAVGQQVYESRKAAGLTQAQLAERIGTTQSVISDLEDAEYEGHSLAMLRRIASALGLSVQVSFVQPPEAIHHASR